MEARVKLQSKLLVAEKQVAEGAELLDHDQVIASDIPTPPKSEPVYTLRHFL